jgi:hypothetical protein
MVENEEAPRASEGHPVRIVVEDDLRRSRLTVFFRLLLAVPHYVWLFLWSIAAFVAAVINWVATLVIGRSPEALHRFLSAYVRYVTHVYAYLFLAANPYPGFSGSPGSYPVDVEIAPPERQARWTALLRIVLAWPAFMLSSVLGVRLAGVVVEDPDTGKRALILVPAGLIVTLGLLAWFAAMARGRMPSGFRDLLAYALRYNAQVWAYMLLLTDRYPTSDPYDPPAASPERPLAVRMTLDDDLRRSRLTVFFRLLLGFPHYVWLLLWSIAGALAIVANWLAALAIGRSPAALHRFLAAFIRYQAHVYAFVSLAANPFPGFTGARGYPLDLDVDAPAPQRRLITLFRLILVIPALILWNVLALALEVAAIFGWFVSLIRGRMPPGFRNLIAYVIHYQARLNAYAFLLTDRYPYSGPVTGMEVRKEPAPEPETWPPAAPVSP